MGVRGLVTLLGNETPLSLTLEIGLLLGKQEWCGRGQMQAPQPSQGSLPSNRGRVWRGQDADAILKIGKYLRATTN